MRFTRRQWEALKVLQGPQRHTALIGGARSGKTFLFLRAILVRALRAEGSRHAVLRFRFNAVRSSVWLDTLPKVMDLCFPGIGLVEHSRDGFVQLPNDAQIWFGGLDEKERVEKILGQEYASIFFNECSQIPYSSVVIAQTRLAQKVGDLVQRAYYDLNPTTTAHWTHRLFVEHKTVDGARPLPDPENYRMAVMNPADNAENLGPDYLASLEALPERQRRRFYEGEYVADVEGALWTLDMIERQRIDPADKPRLRRVVIAIDPSGTSGEEDKRSDEVGIIVAAVGQDGDAYVLADRSGRYSPEAWGRVVAQAAKEFGADKVVAEVNFGGAMVRAVLQAADRNLPFKALTASRGKHVRAEPIASLYEQKRVWHVGRFAKLEDQMAAFSTAGYLGDRSPDRADALVWAITELMLGGPKTVTLAPPAWLPNEEPVFLR